MPQTTADIGDLILDDRFKGIPGGTAEFQLRDIAARHWNVLAEDLSLPVCVLKDSALEHNSSWMRRFLDQCGAAIAPHGKTTMSPQLFERQIRDGAWAITVATVHQLQICRRFGFDRVVLANQLIGREAIRYVLDELKADQDFDFYCLVDSVEGVDQLARAAATHPIERPVKVLLEGGVMGGRTGCRDLNGALTVARKVHASAPHVALHGVEGFEGLIAAQSPAEQGTRIDDFLDYLVEIACGCEREGLLAPGQVVLSAGGSAFYDRVAARLGQANLGRGTLVLTRSGCYLSHDSVMYRNYFSRLRERTRSVDVLGEGLRPALEIWTYVQSRPEREKVILTLGRRDASHDAELPVPTLWFRPQDHHAPATLEDGCVVSALNDQHAHMQVPGNCPLRVGDMVAFGISHPCTTFDKWQLVYVVDDNYNVVSAVKTYF